MPAHVFGVLMSLEPVVAAIAGFVVLGQHLGARDLVAIGARRRRQRSARRVVADGRRPSTCSNQGRPAGILRACSRLNLPNVLTVLRILLVPVLVVALLGRDATTATCWPRSSSRSPR